ncbi:MAG: hypothetical protein ACR2QF_07515 [Geminicoccaceae bacterium]
MARDALDQLEKQEKELKAKLMAVRKAIEEERSKKNSIVGAAVLAEAQANPSYRAKLMKVLDKHIKGKRDRALVGLDGTASSEGDHRVTGD